MKLLPLPVVSFIVAAGASAYSGLWVLAGYLVAAALVCTWFDARAEIATQRAEAAGCNMRGARMIDGLFDLVAGGLVLLAALFIGGIL